MLHTPVLYHLAIATPKLGAMKPMITMYTVANIDSALWGTRSIGEVKSTSTVTNSDSDTDSDAIGQAEATPPRRANGGSDGRVMVRDFALSRGDAPPAVAAAVEAHEEEAMPRKHPGSGAPEISGGGRRKREVTESGAEVRHGRKVEGGGKQSGRLSLRTWKFIILAPWVLVNVGVTVAFLWWRLYTLALVGFFLQIAGMAAFIVAAWVEMRLQRRSARPPSRPPQVARYALTSGFVSS